MNEHKALRYGNEWQCSRCGKAWHVKDENPPDCIDTNTTEYKKHRLNLIRQEIHKNENDNKN